jgi:hypothetical protein
LLEKLPVAPLALFADDLDQMALQIVTDGIVVEEGLVDIDEKHAVNGGWRHRFIIPFSETSLPRGAITPSPYFPISPDNPFRNSSGPAQRDLG